MSATDANSEQAQAVTHLAAALKRAHGRDVAIHPARLLSDRCERGQTARLIRSWFVREVVWFEFDDVLAPEGVYLYGNRLLVSVDASATRGRA